MRVVPDSQHQQIGDDLDCQSGIDALSATQSHLTNLQDGLESTPELLDAMMLLPDGQYLTCSQLPTKHHYGLELPSLSKQQQYQFPGGWTLGLATCDRCVSTPPLTFYQFDLTLMFTQWQMT